MNTVTIMGKPLNQLRYDVILDTSESVLRILIGIRAENQEFCILPVVLCNQAADKYRKPLLHMVEQHDNIIFMGYLQGRYYTDSNGAVKYQNYLVATRFGLSLDGLYQLDFQPLVFQKLPLSVEDLEDILKFMG